MKYDTCPKCGNGFMVDNAHCWKCGWILTRKPTQEEMDETEGLGELDIDITD